MSSTYPTAADGEQLAQMRTPSPDVDVVVGAALVRGGRVLMVHRSPQRRWYPDVWDLPGGHVEAGEPIARTTAQDLVMDVWAVDAWMGEPVNAAPDEHDDLEWLTPQDLIGRALAHPDLTGQVRRALQG